MLDSGAFSAWTRGEVIALGDYIEYVKSRRRLLDTYINLDVIPGQRGVRPTLREVDHAAAASFDNYMSMRAEGLSPIPVYHFGENIRWLEKLLDAGADYICLGGTVGTRTGTKRKFLDECFSVLTNGRGEPLARVHGLGIGEGRFVTRYPWYSVDSTSWVFAPIYGMILVPGLIEDRFSAQVYIGSGHLDAAKSGRRLEALPASAQEHVVEFARSCGFSVTDLRNDQYARTVVFVRCLQLMRPARRFTRRGGSFLVGRRDGTPVEADFRMVFATNLTYAQGWILTTCGARDRLLSYADLRRNDAALEEYVERGVHGGLRSRPDVASPERKRAKVDWDSMNYHDDRRRRLVARLGEEDDEPEAAP